MAHILFIASDFPPLNNIGSRRMFAFAKYLARAGHAVCVVTPKKHAFAEEMSFEADTSPFLVEETPFPDLRAFLHRALRVRRYDDLDGARPGRERHLCALAGCALRFCHVRSVFLGTLRMPNFLDLWIPSAVKSAERLIRERAVDVVITSYGPPAAHLIGYLLKKRFPGLTWIGDYRDAWTRGGFRQGLPGLRILERRLERACAASMDAATVATETIGRSLAPWLNGKEATLIENGYDEELFEEIDAGERPQDGRLRLVFAGTLYPQRDRPEPLFRALGEIIAGGTDLAGRLEVVFDGNYHTASMVRRLLARYPLEGVVRYGGHLSARRIGREMMEADALLFFEDDSTDDGTLTGKIFEYLYTRKPIICIGVDRGSSVGEFLHKTGVAFLCGDDVGRIKALIVRLRGGDLAVRPNEELIRRFSRRRGAEKLDAVIRARTGHGRIY